MQFLGLSGAEVLGFKLQKNLQPGDWGSIPGLEKIFDPLDLP